MLLFVCVNEAWERVCVCADLYLCPCVFLFVCVSAKCILMHKCAFTCTSASAWSWVLRTVREKKQCVDRTGLKLSTQANNVKSMAISWPSILVSACCSGPNPVNLHHNAIITILKLLHPAPGSPLYWLDTPLSLASPIHLEPHLKPVLPKVIAQVFEEFLAKLQFHKNIT